LKKSEALDAVIQAREVSKKRNFLQTFEMMINFVGMDMKKPTSLITARVAMPHSTGQAGGKILVFAKTTDFADSLKERVEKIIMENELEAMSKDRKAMADLMTYDASFAEGPVMLTIAKFMGQQLAPKGKMPKPIMSANEFEETLKKTKTETIITNKKGKPTPLVQIVVGKEDMKNEELAENMVAAYNGLVNVLPQKRLNVKSVLIKTTMGKPVKVGDKK